MEFKKCGNNVKIYPNAIIINSQNIIIGNNVKIDDFVFFDGGKKTILGDYIHIAPYTSISGGGEFIMEDFAGLSSGIRIITGTEDFSGEWLTNPTIPEEFRKPIRSFICMKKHSIMGANSVIFPGVTLGEGSVVGANSLVMKDCDPWTVYVGSPCKPLKLRPKDRILDLEKKLREKYD